MKPTVAVPAALLLASLAVGCADKHEKSTKGQIELYEELNEVLATVTDKYSLESAIPKLETLNNRMKKLADERLTMGKQTEKERRRARAKYDARLGEQSRTFAGHVRRIMELKGLTKRDIKAFQDAIKDIDAES